MASEIPAILGQLALNATPQQTFHQADELLQQAAELTRQADRLRRQSHSLDTRAGILINTANGLQQIAFDDRANMQHLLDAALQGENDDPTHPSNPLECEDAAALAEIRRRVEDGMITMGELEAFLQGVSQPENDNADKTINTHDRIQRSLAPEPETPPSPSAKPLSTESAGGRLTETTATAGPAPNPESPPSPSTRRSIETTDNGLEPQSRHRPTLKRKLSAIKEEDVTLDGSDQGRPAKKAKTHNAFGIRSRGAEDTETGADDIDTDGEDAETDTEGVEIDAEDASSGADDASTDADEEDSSGSDDVSDIESDDGLNLSDEEASTTKESDSDSPSNSGSESEAGGVQSSPNCGPAASTTTAVPHCGPGCVVGSKSRWFHHRRRQA